MHMGVFTVLFQHLSFEDMLNQVAAAGLSSIEVGTGGYPGNQHCPVDELLESATRRQIYLDAIHSRGLTLDAFCASSNPLHPNPAVAQPAREEFRKAVRLAELLSVPVVGMVSGLAAGAPGDGTPNWVTCPWPPEFQTMLAYQWNEVTIPYWAEAGGFAADHGVRIGIEMHPGMMIYNVETLLKLRGVVGPMLGCTFDPSHLFWNGVDPVAAIEALGPAIVHVHGKDCARNERYIAVHGCNDGKPYEQLAQRAWTFRTIGYGHDVKAWKDIISALRLVGYDGAISIEHEDPLLSASEGLAKAIAVLQEALLTEPIGQMYWA